jgi:hypothetical protein
MFPDTPLAGEGPSAAVPYGAGRRRISAGEPVIVDYTGAVDGYICDQTRTLVLGALPDRLRADGARPPFVPERLAEVVVLGNTLGFSGARADLLLDAAECLVTTGGTLLLEIAPSSGERSRYLARLPPSALVRLLHSPLRAVLGRLDREGFRDEPPRHTTPRSFRRYSVDELHVHLRRLGWEVRETIAVAPALGADPERAAAVRKDPQAWTRLLDLEEEIGQRPERWPRAAAVLVAARRPSSMRMIK